MAQHITASNRGPLVQIFTWFFFFVGLFFFVVRLVTKHALASPYKIEDAIIIVAIILSLGQSIAVSAAVSNGLGKPLESLNEAQIEATLKSQYVAIILLIACLGTTKLSIAVFVKGLSPDVHHHRYSNWIGLSSLVWMVIGLISAIFQCSPPHTWDPLNGNHCVNLRAWWTFIALGNMLTDVFIVAVQFFLLWGVQLPMSNKFILFSIFSFRLGVVGATIAQLYVYYQSFDSLDITLRAWLPALLNQLIQSLSISTACIPHLKRFLDSLESGMIRVREPSRMDNSQVGTELGGVGGSNSTRASSKKQRISGSLLR
ncbi:uncharacterized protein BDR25DRAFT_288944 [Lindgomyces ingoldianus]|uniref:Uncharacterized protein n=1 Tax=Lindgomyces ingoldianus TaxID=673940 RepID=A0ACB6QQX9_9PLEO|nr:uncharacterized protein BDR25DRAFT_288944 [Lindgomyces ingoldianus]KAF2469393.1 hypothetical protein BDR25DRAFT_288944 [Lindgomyces ingoldianus]